MGFTIVALVMIKLLFVYWSYNPDIRISKPIEPDNNNFIEYIGVSYTNKVEMADSLNDDMLEFFYWNEKINLFLKRIIY